MMELKYKKASSTIKPLEVDDKVSRDYIYIRRNIENEGDRYTFEEACIPKRLYEIESMKEILNDLLDTSKVLSDEDFLQKIKDIIQTNEGD